MDPGKPHTGSARSRAVAFLLPLPHSLGNAELWAQDCITATQPFPCPSSTGGLSAQVLLITSLGVSYFSGDGSSML